jgi:hypothetical protein
VSLTLDPMSDTMRVTAWDHLDWSPRITDALHEEPTALVGLELSSPRPLAVPVTGLRDDWFLIPVRGASPQLDLRNLLDALDGELPTVHDGLVGDVTRTVGTASLADLPADPDLPSGLLAMFDPAGWFIPSLGNADTDARETGDADAEALAGLGEAMRAQIDGGIEEFLQNEMERGRAERVPLRHRFRDDRDHRQVLRRGMRGARRRHRTLVSDGLRRAFRLGRSRRLTYTELLMGCHVEGVVDVLHRLDQRVLTPRLELQGSVYGEPGQQYLIARLPSPHEPLAGYEMVLTLPAPESRLSIRYRRWGAEDSVAGEVDSGQLSLADGRLPLPLEFVDGAEPSPTISVHSESPDGEPDDLPGDPPVVSLRVAGVQHGDVLVFTETVSGASAEVAVVKNFSRNDLERLHAAGFQLTAPEPFGDLGGLTSAVTGAIGFILADGPGTAQDDQRRALAAALAGTAPQAGDPPRADPATLDIPSARGVGLFPDDASHLHLRVPSIPAELQTRTDEYRTIATESLGGVQPPGSLPYHADAQYRSQLTAHHGYWHGDLAGVLEQFAQAAGATVIWYTYEIDQDLSPQYLLAGNLLRLWPGDPIRHIRTDLGRAPTLVQVPDLTGTEISDGPSELAQVDMFVNRRAEVVLYVDPDYRTLGLSYGEVLQVADALASLADGGLPPAAPSGEDGPAEPDDRPEPVEEPDEPGSQLGSVLLRVVDDAGDPLPLAWVTVTGSPGASVKTGDDGTSLLTDQAPGSFTATNTGYPGHEPGAVNYDVLIATRIEVNLVLSRIPSNPELPPLRGQLAESSGFYVRVAPGRTSQIIGKLFYHPLDVTVLEAVEIPVNGPPVADLWYRVRFAPGDYDRAVREYSATLIYAQDSDPTATEEIARHTDAVTDHQGTEAWVGQAAMTVLAMPWGHFLGLLDEFEAAHPNEDLLTRLSRVRKLGEEADVPADDVVGVSDEYIVDQPNRGQRAHDPDRWSLLFEAKQVEVPGGEIVDIHHFLLGMEASVNDGRRSEDRTIAAWGVLPLKMGESYSAVTWSGDVGATATDMLLRQYQDWEEAVVLPRPENEVLAFYFRASAPDFDLLADIDAWGAHHLVPYEGGPPVPIAPDSLVSLLTVIYGPAGEPPAWQLEWGGYRAQGIHELLTHYGFTSSTNLSLQSEPVGRMQEQVLIVAKTFFTVREAGTILSGLGRAVAGLDPEEVAEALEVGDPRPTEDQAAELADLSARATDLFLTWLEELASRHAVMVP